MYSVDDIKEILGAFDKSKTTKLEIKTADGERLTIAHQTEQVVVSSAAVTVPPAEVHTALPDTRPSASPFIQPEESEQPDDGSSPVASPMVGVFYAAPSPDSEAYVSVGSTVKKGDVLCLIEAMKLMNEVTAEKSGEITKICVENGQVVEYGQPLFMIK